LFNVIRYIVISNHYSVVITILCGPNCTNNIIV